jgi:hypothetical protein
VAATAQMIRPSTASALSALAVAQQAAVAAVVMNPNEPRVLVGRPKATALQSFMSPGRAAVVPRTAPGLNGPRPFAHPLVRHPSVPFRR